MIPITWTPTQPAFKNIVERFARATAASPDKPLYVVGGAVRDYLLTHRDTYLLTHRDTYLLTHGDTTSPGRKGLLGRKGASADLDLVLVEDVMAVSRRVADAAGWAFYPLDESRGLARLVFTQEDGTQLVCDVSQQRGETLESDLLGRDFTINAMAFAYVPGRGTVDLIDVCGGVDDLARGQLRRVTETSLSSDPLRLLRAVRLAAQFGFTIEPATRDQIGRLAERIVLSSPERMRDELWKALSTPDPAAVVEELRALALLPHLLPEVAATVGVTQSAPHHLDVYEHTLQTVTHAAHLRDWLASHAAPYATLHSTPPVTPQKNETPAEQIQREALLPLAAELRAHFGQALATGHTRGQWLVWHALLHDVGKPQTRSLEHDAETGCDRVRFLGHEAVSAEVAEARLTTLRFSRREIGVAISVARHHMRPHFLHASFAGKALSRRASYRFFRHCDGQNPRQLTGVDVALLALADYRAIHHGAIHGGAIQDGAIHGGNSHRELHNATDQNGSSGEALAAWRAYVAHVGQLLSFAFAGDGWQAVRQQPLINGTILMRELNLSPGRAVGQILEQLAEAQAAGEIRTADEALRLASTFLGSNCVAQTNG